MRLKRLQRVEFALMRRAEIATVGAEMCHLSRAAFMRTLCALLTQSRHQMVLISNRRDEILGGRQQANPVVHRGPCSSGQRTDSGVRLRCAFDTARAQHVTARESAACDPQHRHTQTSPCTARIRPSPIQRASGKQRQRRHARSSKRLWGERSLRQTRERAEGERARLRRQRQQRQQQRTKQQLPRSL